MWRERAAHAYSRERKAQKAWQPLKIFRVGTQRRKRLGLSEEWGHRRRSVGRHIFAQYEKEVCKHAWEAESSGLGNRSGRRLGLIFGLSVFLSLFYTGATKRQSHAELIAKVTDPSLAVPFPLVSVLKYLVAQQPVNICQASENGWFVWARTVWLPTPHWFTSALTKIPIRGCYILKWHWAVAGSVLVLVSSATMHLSGLCQCRQVMVREQQEDPKSCWRWFHQDRFLGWWYKLNRELRLWKPVNI